MKSPTQKDIPEENKSNSLQLPPNQNFPSVNQTNNYTTMISQIEFAITNIQKECEILLQKKRYPQAYLNYSATPFISYKPNLHPKITSSCSY